MRLVVVAAGQMSSIGWVPWMASASREASQPGRCGGDDDCAPANVRPVEAIWGLDTRINQVT